MANYVFLTFWVTLTVTFDLDLEKFGQGQIFEKNRTFSNLVE